MRKIALVVLTLLTTTIFSNNYITEVFSSDSTDLNHSAEYAIDGDSSRGWSLNSSETRGWINLKLDNKYSINGIVFTGEISEHTKIVVSFKDKNGIFRDFFTSINQSIKSGEIIDLSFDKVVTNELTIKLYENGSLRSSISDIELLTNEIDTNLQLQEVDDISASGKTSVYSSEYNLIDGNPETYWRVEKNLDWSNVQWAVRKYLEERYEYDRYDTWGNEGSVTFELEDTLLEKIRFYVPYSVDGFYKLEIKNDDDWQVISNNERLTNGWLEKSINQQYISEVRLTINSDDPKNFPEIGEVEFWGVEQDTEDEDDDYDDDDINVEYLTMDYTPDGLDNSDIFFEWSSEDYIPEIEVVTDKNNNSQLELNGKSISQYRTIDLGDTYLKVYRPEARELFDGYNFINIPENLGVRLRYTEEWGYVKETEHSLNDGLLYSSTNISDNEIIALNSPVFIERAEVFTSYNSGARVYAFVEDEWIELIQKEYDKNRTVYYGGVTTSQLRVSYGKYEVKEVRIWGSEYPDVVPDIKILYPPSGEDFQSHEPSYNVLVGEIDQLGCEITVNGIEADTYGNIFWVELKKLELPKAGLVDISVVARNEAGVVSTKPINILLQHNGYKDSVDGDEVEFTNKETYTISGESNQWRSRLFINGTEYSIDGHDFSHEMPLKSGYNQFKIEFKDKKNNLAKLFFKTVYKYSGDIVLETNENNVVTNNDEIKITGFVKGFGDIEVEVNGEEADISGFSYTSDNINLNEGNNQIKVKAFDEFGNTKEIVINVIKDSRAPLLKDIKPLKDSIISTDNVTFTGNVSDSSDVKVFVNNNIAALDNNSFSRELFFVDGLNIIEIYAVDKVGNRSETYTTQVLTDTTAPNSFSVYADPEGWTNNRTPVLTFNAVDDTSGIDFYQLKIGDGNWSNISSPYKLNELIDGIHTVNIKAVDRAGHFTIETTKVYIDTTAPLKPEVFRAVPKNDSIELLWTKSVSEDTKEYRVTRAPNWVDGHKTINKTVTEFVDADVDKNSTYQYKLFTVDRADNLSEAATTDTVIVGIEVEKYNRSTGSVVEYEDISIIIPEEALPEDILEIHVTEAESPELEEKANNFIIGPMYNTSVVRNVNNERVHQEHALFEKDFLATINYSEEDFPNGLLEQNIGVYYFDPMWDRWFLIEDSTVDTTNNRIFFKTNHFTDFSVQPVLVEELTPQDYESMGVSPNIKNGHSGVSVDPQSGALSMTVEEFNLPGKAGFDFTLRRTYNSIRARKDSFNMALAKSLDYTHNPSEREFDIWNKLNRLSLDTDHRVETSMAANLLTQYKNKGDYSYSMGAGWKLDLPSINNTSQYINLILPGGAIYSVNQMDLIDTLPKEGGRLRYLVFENHITDDFQLTIKQTRTELHTLKTRLLKDQPVTGEVAADLFSYKVNSWAMYEAELTLKNGTKYIFDSMGRIKVIIDPYGVNEVSFAYDFDKLTTITDSMGRVITFNYTTNHHFVPMINRISVKDFSNTTKNITYTIDNSGYMGLLRKATDIQGRLYNYGYDGRSLINPDDKVYVERADLINNFLDPGAVNLLAKEVIGVENLELSETLNPVWVDTLLSVKGPGIGNSEITYSSDSLIYSKGVDSKYDHYNGIYNIDDGFSYEMMKNLVVTKTNVEDKVTTYDYNFDYVGYRQFINNKTTTFDGKKTVEHYFVDYHLERNKWFDLSAIEEEVNEDEEEDYTEHLNKYFLMPAVDRVVLKTGDSVINTQYFTYDPISVKPLSRSLAQGNLLSKKISFEYDKWGNITKQKEVSKAHDRVTEVESTMSYKYTSSIKNLVKSIKTVSSNPVNNTSTTQFQEFDYYPNNRLLNSKIKSDNTWLTTTYEYDSVGNISKITDPENNVQLFQWNYSNNPFYTLTETSKAVKFIDDNGTEYSKDVIKKTAFEYNSGLLAWGKDLNGYVTEYKYDSLGRLLETKKDETTSEPSTRLTSSANFFEKITYDDVNLKATVINAEKQKSTYSYDLLGQLIEVNNDSSTTPLITKLNYDNWGNVISIINPANSTINYEYDELNKNRKIIFPNTNYGLTAEVANKDLDFNYTTNTQTITDERGKKSYKVFDMDNREIETGYYDSTLGRVPLTKTYYDGFGNIVIQEDAKGNQVINTYNERNLLVKTEFPVERFYEDDTLLTPYVRYEYNNIDQRVKEYRSTKTSEEYETTFKNDVFGRVYEVITPVTESNITNNISQKFAFDNNGNNTAIIDGNGNKTTFLYNYLNQMIDKTDSENNTTKYEYDKLGNITKMSDPREGKGYESTFTIDYIYDDLNRLEYALLPQSYNQLSRNRIEFEYDLNGNVLNRIETDGNNNLIDKTNYVYNKRHMLLEESKVDSNGTRAFITKYTYSKSGLRTGVTDAENKSIITSYDELGRTKSVLHDSGITERYEYDLNSNPTRFYDGKNNVTETTYDSYNRVKSVTKVATTSTSSTVNYKYDERGNRVYFEDGINNISRYNFDELNRVSTETNSRGYTSSYTYDNVGNIKSKTDFNGSVFSYGYKPNNLLESVNITNTNKSKSLTYQYDEAGSLKSSVDDGVVTRYNHDSSSNYQADPFDRIFRITTELDGKTHNIDYDYDNAGRITNITYPSSHSVSSTYNQFGQLMSLGDYTSGSISYYNNGLLKEYRSANGITYNNTYDSDNRVSSFNYYNDNSVNLDSYSFTYDDSNNIIEKVVNGRVNTYSWDELNQLIRADNQGEFEIDPTKLDVTQKLGTVQEDYVGQKPLDFNVDETELKLDYNSISIGFDIGMDTKLNRLVINPESISDRLREDKFAIYTSDDNQSWQMMSRDLWSFNPDDISVEISFKDPVSSRYIKLHCFYDDRSEMGVATDLSQIRNSRDSLLTAFITVDRMIEKFSYDSAGNRHEYNVNYTNNRGYVSAYTYYDNSNLIKSDNKFGYIWDKNGNLVEKSDDYTVTGNEVTIKTDTGNYTKYSYDLLNRLVKVELSTSGSNNISKEINYTYDHRGYRLKRVGSKVDDVTYYSFGLSGEILYKENPSKDKYEEYIYLFGQHYAKEVGKLSLPNDKTRMYYHTDHLGSTIAITDVNGDKIWSNNYTSFGKSTNESGLIEELGIYTSKEIDPETGLYYFNARWYDPEMGRFITEDPIKDGDNWYIYCANNPLTYIDPTGLSGENAGGWQQNTPASGPKTYSTRQSQHEGNYATPLGQKIEFNINLPIIYSFTFIHNIKIYDEATQDYWTGVKDYVESGLYDSSFQDMTVNDQMVYLKAIYELGEEVTDLEKGALAIRSRALRDSMDLYGLFNTDYRFMNDTFRNFLNINEYGNMEYDYDVLSTSKKWKEMISFGSQYHQTHASKFLNAKFVNEEDGREVVFDRNRKVVNNLADKGTYNYVNGEISTSIGEGGHKVFDIDPYFAQMAAMNINVTPKVNMTLNFKEGNLGPFTPNSKSWYK